VIFGDRDAFALQVDQFTPPWETADLESDAVWASVALWVAGANVTEHRRLGTDRIRDSVYMPLVPLTRWFAGARAALRFEERSPLGSLSSPHDELERWSKAHPPAGFDADSWLDRRDAWWSRHFTGYATRDVVAPSLGLVRSDHCALISWRTPDLPRSDRAFVRPRGASVVSWDVVYTALAEYVAAVESWTPNGSAVQVDDSSPLEYYTGLTLDEVQAFNFLPEAAADPAVDPLAQVIRDLTHRTATGPAQESIERFVRTPDRPEGHDWWTMRNRLVATQTNELEGGYDAAQTARSLLDLDGQPIDDVQGIAQELDIDVAAESPMAARDRMLVVGQSAGQATTMVLENERTSTPWGRRFELARALGHLLLDPLRGNAIGAASGPHAMASRRRRSGAFAAEFLLPSTALTDASDGALDGIAEGTRFADLLGRFGVGAHTAAFHLWNQGLLSSPELREDLIASV
jgi:hypothetical protein